MNKQLQDIITSAFAMRDQLNAHNMPQNVQQAVQEAIKLLNLGKLRVALYAEGTWQVQPWVKQAILLYFIMRENQLLADGLSNFYDKISLKFDNYTAADFVADGVRVVPRAVVRYGAYLAPRTVLMPCYINIGAYIDTGCMIDTWATVGSCAQIGKCVHISGGAGIGGVLEPSQNLPTIIEDDCFIGARSEVVEGVLVEQGSVIAMGVYLGQSTKIYNRLTDEITYGLIPAGSVVVPGSLPSNDGKYSLACAVIVKQVDTITQQKTALNDILR